MIRRIFERILLTTLAGALLVTAALPSQAGAASRAHSLGLGVILGEPTGLSMKYFLNGNHAIDGGLAYSFDDYFLIFADHLWHFPRLFGAQNRFVAQLVPYIGIGAILIASTDSGRRGGRYFDGSSIGLGMRLPVGLEWFPGSPPLGIFVELVPGLGIIPSTFGFLEGGVGIRYFF